MCVGEGVTECKWRRTFNCHYMNRQTDNAPSCKSTKSTCYSGKNGQMEAEKKEKRKPIFWLSSAKAMFKKKKKKSYDAVTKVLERR